MLASDPQWRAARGEDVEVGDSVEQRVTMSAVAPGSCSRLSSTSSAPVPSSASASSPVSDVPGASRTPTMFAIAAGTSVASEIEAEPDEVNRPLEGGFRGRLEREAALACPTWTRDRDQADIGTCEQLLRGREVVAPTRRVGDEEQAASSHRAPRVGGSPRLAQAATSW